MIIEKELILNSFYDVYRNMIDVEKVTNKQFEISLPIFLNTGDTVSIILEELNNKYILKNTMYSRLEESLNKYIGFDDLRRKYLLGDKKFKELKKEKLKNNLINNSLFQEKEISLNSKNDLLEEIFAYIFNTTTYYNFIYDYIIENLKNDNKILAFKETLENFVKNYNKKNKKNFSKIKNIDFTSTYNSYYIDNNGILTGANNKFHFLEAIYDLEILDKKYKNNLINIKILKGKGDLKEDYINKVLRDKKKLKDKISWIEL
jgi:hypothetical protein